MEAPPANRRGLLDCRSEFVTILVPAIAGMAYALSVYSRIGFAFSWFAMAAFAFSVRLSKTWAQCRRVGMLFGLSFFGIQFDFLRTIEVPGNWLGFGPLTLFWMVLVLGGAMVWQFCSIAIRWLWHERGYPCFFALPVAVLTVELLVECFARFVLKTSGGACQLALRQVDCPWLLQAAAGGSWTVSWLTAALIGLGIDNFCCLPVWCEGTARRHQIPFAIAFLLMLGLSVCQNKDGWTTASAAGPRILIVPAFVSLGDEHTGLKGLVRLAKSAPQFQIAIWPEFAIPTITSTPIANDPLDEIVSTLKCSALVGGRRIDPDRLGPLNSAVCVTWPDRRRSFYDKRFLMPGFEGGHSLLPFQSWFINSGNSFDESNMYLEGRRPRGALLLPTFTTSKNVVATATFGVGICHDICFAEWGVDWMHMADPPNFFVQIANESDDWTWRIQPLLLAMARLRAVETQRTVVRCVRNGLSGVIGPDGRLLQLADRDDHHRPFVTEPIPLVREIGIGIRIGHIPCLIFAVSLTWIIGCVLRNRRTRSEIESGTVRI